MATVADQLLAIYAALRGTPDDETIAQITQFDNQLYSHPSILLALLEILHHADPYFRQQAAIGLGRVLANPGNVDQAALAQELLDLVAAEANPLVRRNVAEVFTWLDARAIEPTVLAFAAAAAASLDDAAVHAALLVLGTDCVDLDDKADSYDVVTTLIEKGLGLGIEAVYFGCDLVRNTNPELPLGSALWGFIIGRVVASLGDPKMLEMLCKVLDSQLMDEDAPEYPVFATAAPVFEALAPLVNSPDIDPQTQLILLIALDAALLSVPFLEAFCEDEDGVIDLAERYFGLSARLFNVEDSLCLSLVDVFESISCALDDCEAYINYLFGNAEELYQRQETRPGLLLALGHALPGRDTLRGFLNEFVAIVVQGISDPIKMVREAAARCIYELAVSAELHGRIDDWAEDLVQAAITSLDSEPNDEILRAVAALLDEVTDTDAFFEPVYTWFMGRLQGAGQTAQQQLFPCLTALSMHSSSAVRQHFDDVFPFISSLVPSPLLGEHALKCLSHMSKTCSDQFAPHTLEFARIVVPLVVGDVDHDKILGLQSLYLLFQRQGSHLEELLPGLVPSLLQIGNTFVDIVAEVEELERALEAHGAADLELDVEEEEADIRPCAIPAFALRLLGRISLQFPAVFRDNVAAIIGALEKQMGSHQVDTLDASLEAMEHFAHSAEKTGTRDVAAPFAQWSLSLLDGTKDEGLASLCFAVLEAVIGCCGAEAIGEQLSHVFDCIVKCLNGELFCEAGAKVFVPELHQAMASTIKQLIASLRARAPTLLEPLFPILTNLASDKNEDWRNIAIELLGQFVQGCGDQFSEGFLNDVLIFAIAGVQNDSPCAAFAINQFTLGAPSVLAEKVCDVLELFHTKLCAPRKKAQVHLEFIDNIVAAVGEIQRLILKDAFPIAEFLRPCLAAMPAKYDPDVNKEMFLFYLWLAEKTGIEPADEFAAAVIRLLGLPEHEMGDEIVESDIPVLRPVATVLGAALQKVEDPDSFVDQMCDGDAFRVERVGRWLQDPERTGKPG
jgi:hypothetical protein